MRRTGLLRQLCNNRSKGSRRLHEARDIQKPVGGRWVHQLHIQCAGGPLHFRSSGERLTGPGGRSAAAQKQVAHTVYTNWDVDRDRMRPDTDTDSVWFIAEGRPKKKKKN
jgi:hypothetical protein